MLGNLRGGTFFGVSYVFASSSHFTVALDIMEKLTDKTTAAFERELEKHDVAFTRDKKSARH